MRRFACMILIREDGKFLLQHRTEDAPRHPGYWGFFGGHIEEGETPEQAMIRETKEELDIDVVDYTLTIQQRYVHDLATEGGERWIYTAPFEKQGPITQHEGQGMGWYSLDEIDTIKIAPHHKEALVATLAAYKKNGT